MPMKSDELWQLIAFRAPPGLVQAIDRQARDEGISRSDVVRRAAMRDLRRQHALTDEQSER
jgi:metal-responsive CopG/Arc/MetJ family transcriptional regulator